MRLSMYTGSSASRRLDVRLELVQRDCTLSGSFDALDDLERQQTHARASASSC